MKRRLTALLLAFILPMTLLSSCGHSGAGRDNDTPDSVFGARYDASDTWAIYWYICGGMCLIEKLPQTAMSDENTVASFLRFCNDNYPADRA